MRWIWLLLVLVLCGCGVRPTDPVPGGAAPVGAARGPMLVFLRNGELAPVVRETGRLGTVQEAVVLLMRGPTGQEVAGGYTSLLSPLSVTVGALEQGVVPVTIGAPLSQLPEQAKDQVVCTVIAVHAQEGANASGLVVRLQGPPDLVQGPSATITVSSAPVAEAGHPGRRCPLVR